MIDASANHIFLLGNAYTDYLHEFLISDSQ
jgi:hypothetical protein